MSDPIPDHVLVVVADGGKAFFYRRTSSSGTVSLREERALTPDSMREQGPSGSRPKEQTGQQTDEESFANRLGHVLHTMHQHGEFEALVLVLDPQTLGQLRGSMHKTVERTVVRTLTKDLTNHPLKDLGQALSD